MRLGVIRHLITHAGRQNEFPPISQFGFQATFQTQQNMPFFTPVIRQVTWPSGFVRIRHYGLLGNRCRHEKLSRCHALLSQPEPQPLEAESVEAMMSRLVGIDIQLCPICRQGKLRVIAELVPIRTFPPLPKATGPP